MNNLPFSRAQFFSVFAQYNEAMWPAQIVLYALAIVAAVVVFRRTSTASRVTNGILAALWLWMAVAYHAAFFSEINRGAILFAVLFAIQSSLFAWLAVRRGTMYQPKNNLAGWAGAALMIFGLAIYPMASIAAGHTYPAQPTFGLPCPTTIFTLGILLWAGEMAPKRVFVIPVVWAAIGTLGALNIGVIEDLSLPLAVVVTGIIEFSVVRRGNQWSARKGLLRAASPLH
jgi:hypothetical protein